MTVQLTNTRTGEHVWAQRFDEDSADIIAVQETIADKIYKSVAGLEGGIRKEEERSAWRKVSTTLDEYDYYLRGHSFFFRGTCDDTMRARYIWEDGLRQFPNSALLRIKIAFTYTNAVENYCSGDPSGDIERAWALGREASANAHHSALATWLAHWLMTVLYQWHDKDFERSIGEAESAVRTRALRCPLTGRDGVLPGQCRQTGPSRGMVLLGGPWSVGKVRVSEPCLGLLLDGQVSGRSDRA